MDNQLSQTEVQEGRQNQRTKIFIPEGINVARLDITSLHINQIHKFIKYCNTSNQNDSYNERLPHAFQIIPPITPNIPRSINHRLQWGKFSRTTIIKLHMSPP